MTQSNIKLIPASKDKAWQNHLWQTTLSGSSFWKVANVNSKQFYSHLINIYLANQSKYKKSVLPPDLSHIDSIARGLSIEQKIVKYFQKHLANSDSKMLPPHFHYQGTSKKISLSGTLDLIYSYEDELGRQNILIYEVKAQEVIRSDIKSISSNDNLIYNDTHCYLDKQHQTIIHGFYQLSFYSWFIQSLYPDAIVHAFIVSNKYTNSRYECIKLSQFDTTCDVGLIMADINSFYSSLELLNNGPLVQDFELMLDFQNDLKELTDSPIHKQINYLKSKIQSLKKKFPLSNNNIYNINNDFMFRTKVNQLHRKKHAPTSIAFIQKNLDF